jgi:uncharacterized protein YggU (UPF0235/DUF167 family)
MKSRIELNRHADLRVRLTPRGGANRIDRFEENTLFVRVSAAPTEGAANRALIALLSDALSVCKSSISIRAGEASRQKHIRFEGITPDQLQHRIDAIGIGES